MRCAVTFLVYHDSASRMGNRITSLKSVPDGARRINSINSAISLGFVKELESRGFPSRPFTSRQKVVSIPPGQSVTTRILCLIRYLDMQSAKPAWPCFEAA